jgi:hypothetical protein
LEHFGYGTRAVEVVLGAKSIMKATRARISLWRLDATLAPVPLIELLLPAFDCTGTVEAAAIDKSAWTTFLCPARQGSFANGVDSAQLSFADQRFDFIVHPPILADKQG